MQAAPTGAILFWPIPSVHRDSDEYERATKDPYMTQENVNVTPKEVMVARRVRAMDLDNYEDSLEAFDKLFPSRQSVEIWLEADPHRQQAMLKSHGISKVDMLDKAHQRKVSFELKIKRERGVAVKRECWGCRSFFFQLGSTRSRFCDILVPSS